MRSWTWTTIIAGSFLYGSLPARAQAGADASRKTLTVSLGAIQETRRDDSASPLSYSGAGPGTRVDYESELGGRTVYASLSAGVSTLNPSRAPSTPAPEESFGSFALATGVQWRMRSGPAQTSDFSFGAELGAIATYARHQYGDPDQTAQSFFVGAVALGPVARWTRPVGAGAVDASFSVPLVALVDRPYTDIRAAQELAQFRLATIPGFVQATGALRYTFHPERRFALAATYRFGFLSIADQQPLRSASQSISVGVVTRFGVVR